jgi:predicted RNase H-like HicB family nuclease
MATRSFTALVQRGGGEWSALCPELDVASQDGTAEEAKANLREAVELFLETASPKEIESRLKAEVVLSPLEVNAG